MRRQFVRVQPSPSAIEEWILPIPGRFFEDYPDGLFFQSDITFDFVFFDPANVGAGAELGSFDWQTNVEGHLLITTETSRSLEFIPFGKLLLGVVEKDDAGNVVGMGVGRGGKRVTYCLSSSRKQCHIDNRSTRQPYKASQAVSSRLKRLALLGCSDHTSSTHTASAAHVWWA